MTNLKHFSMIFNLEKSEWIALVIVSITHPYLDKLKIMMGCFCSREPESAQDPE